MLPVFLESYGLGFLRNDENHCMGFVGHACEKGIATRGYWPKQMTLDGKMGSIQVFSTIETNGKKKELKDFDIHSMSPHVWKLKCTQLDLTPRDCVKTKKLMMMKSAEDGSGLLPIHLFRSDVLPCFLEDEVINVQVSGAAVGEFVNYFATEEEYTASLEKTEDGKTISIAKNTLFPMGFMTNHMVGRDGETIVKEPDLKLDDICLFVGEVKRVLVGFIDEEQKTPAFIRAIIDTQHGELGICHPYDAVPKKLRDNIKAGSIISGLCVVTGDVAIYEYENGIVLDQEHNLRLIRDVFQRGEEERLRTVLHKDVVYETYFRKQRYKGVNAIMERVASVRAANVKCFPRVATVTANENNAAEYPADTKCLALAYDEEDGFESILFCECDAEGLITRINIVPLGDYACTFAPTGI